MEFKTEKRLDQPADKVVDLMINNMEAIAPYMLTVDSIVTEKREQRDNGQVFILRKWQGSKGEAPRAIRPFLSQEMLTWYDDALWTPSEHKVEWSIRSSLGKLYDCGGTNSFGPHPDAPDSATRIIISGQVTIYPERVPGIPKFLARKLAPQVESFIVKMIQPNLSELVDGLRGYFAAQD